MFWHNFKYTLQIIFRDHALVFWTFAFPLILGAFFYLAFSNITSSESLNIINIAVVDNETWQNDQIFRPALAELSSDDSADRLFHTQYVSRDTADQLLADGEISGYLLLEPAKASPSTEVSPSTEAFSGPPAVISQTPALNTPTIFADKSDINSTILQFAIESIAEQASIIEAVAKEDPARLAALAHAHAANLVVDQSGSNLDYTMIEYYSLIAMCCLYGGLIGMVAVNQLLANMSTSGKRIAVSPAPKSLLILGATLASYIVQLLGLALLFAFLIFVLHVDFGASLVPVVLLSLVGSFAGLALGIFLASTVRSNPNLKVGLVLAITMTGCFFAGMMGPSMKYVIDTNLPLLNRVNPANLITDGFYALYYYNTLDRYWGNIITLVIISLVILAVSVYSLRKEQYDRL